MSRSANLQPIPKWEGNVAPRRQDGVAPWGYSLTFYYNYKQIPPATCVFKSFSLVGFQASLCGPFS